MRRFNIALTVTFSGASAQVDAETKEEAYAKAERGDFVDGVDINGAELINWDRIKLGGSDKL